MTPRVQIEFGSFGAEARMARADVERALDARGWLWRRGLSLWVDALLVLEESAAARD